MAITHETSGDLLFRAFTYLTADDLKTVARVLRRGTEILRNDYAVACVAGGPGCAYAVDLKQAHDRASGIAAAAEESAADMQRAG